MCLKIYQSILALLKMIHSVGNETTLQNYKITEQNFYFPSEPSVKGQNWLIYI